MYALSAVPLAWAGLSCRASEGVDPWREVPLLLVEWSENRNSGDLYWGGVDPAVVEKLVVLQVVLNYVWEGETYEAAIRDPIILGSPRISLLEVFSLPWRGKEKVDRAIFLTQGYMVESLSPNQFLPLYVRRLEMQDYLVRSLQKLEEPESDELYRIIARELRSGKIRGDEAFYVWWGDAASSGSILGSSHVTGPGGRSYDAPSWGKYYEIVLVFAGGGRRRSLPVCMSEAGFRALEKALGIDLKRLPEWPELPFLMVDENDVALSERVSGFEPAEVGEVILLPAAWKLDEAGLVSERAVCDPIRVRPGEVVISALAAPLCRDGEAIRRFIVLARGRGPTGLFPVFNCVASYGGRRHILLEVPAVSEELWSEMAKAMLKEIEKEEWVIGPPRVLPDAVRRGVVLSSAWLETRLEKREKGPGGGKSWYTRFALWDRYDEGQKVTVRISSKGRELLREFLQGGGRN